MKITRRQLRKMILQEIRIKPGGDLGLDDKMYSDLESLARHEDPTFQSQGDMLAMSSGYEGDFKQDMDDYDDVRYGGGWGAGPMIKSLMDTIESHVHQPEILRSWDDYDDYLNGKRRWSNISPELQEINTLLGIDVKHKGSNRSGRYAGKGHPDSQFRSPPKMYFTGTDKELDLFRYWVQKTGQDWKMNMHKNNLTIAFPS